MSARQIFETLRDAGLLHPRFQTLTWTTLATEDRRTFEAL